LLPIPQSKWAECLCSRLIADTPKWVVKHANDDTISACLHQSNCIARMLNSLAKPILSQYAVTVVNSTTLSGRQAGHDAPPVPRDLERSAPALIIIQINAVELCAPTNGQADLPGVTLSFYRAPDPGPAGEMSRTASRIMSNWRAVTVFASTVRHSGDVRT